MRSCPPNAGVAMRIFLLVIFEVVALVGIPRLIHELRVALGEKAPPVLIGGNLHERTATCSRFQPAGKGSANR